MSSSNQVAEHKNSPKVSLAAILGIIGMSCLALLGMIASEDSPLALLSQERSSSLASRRSLFLFGGKDGGEATGRCTLYPEEGFCTDGDGEDLPLCGYRQEFGTFEECQDLVKDMDMIGYTADPTSTPGDGTLYFCYAIFDERVTSCPSVDAPWYLHVDRLSSVGSGPIAGTRVCQEKYVCYTCSPLAEV